MWLHVWYDDLQASGGPNETEKASLLDQPIQDGSRASRHRPQQLNQHMQRDVERFDLRLHRHMQLQGMQELSQDQRDPQLDHDQFWTSGPPDLQAQLAFEQLERQFNGTITNDKFCMSRTGRLQLSWWRLPLRARETVTNGVESPSEVNTSDRAPEKEMYEETAMEGSPSAHRAS